MNDFQNATARRGEGRGHLSSEEMDGLLWREAGGAEAAEVTAGARAAGPYRTTTSGATASAGATARATASANAGILRVGNGDDGVEDRRAEAHLAQCALCAGEVASLRAVMADFREASVALSERAWQGAAAGAAAETRSARREARLAPAGAWVWPALAALTLAVLLPALHRPARPHSTASARAGAVIESGVSATAGDSSDDALLREVDADVTASAPDALAPLSAASGSKPRSTVAAQ